MVRCYFSNGCFLLPLITHLTLLHQTCHLMRNLLIYAIILMILASALTIVGALFKLESWPNSSILLTAGTLTWLVAMVMLAVYLLGKKKSV